MNILLLLYINYVKKKWEPKSCQEYVSRLAKILPGVIIKSIFFQLDEIEITTIWLKYKVSPGF